MGTAVSQQEAVKLSHFSCLIHIGISILILIQHTKSILTQGINLAEMIQSNFALTKNCRSSAKCIYLTWSVMYFVSQKLHQWLNICVLYTYIYVWLYRLFPVNYLETLPIKFPLQLTYTLSDSSSHWNMSHWSSHPTPLRCHSSKMLIVEGKKHYVDCHKLLTPQIHMCQDGMPTYLHQ